MQNLVEARSPHGRVTTLATTAARNGWPVVRQSLLESAPARTRRTAEETEPADGPCDGDDHYSHVLNAVHKILTDESLDDDERHEKIKSLMKVINPAEREDTVESVLRRLKAGTGRRGGLTRRALTEALGVSSPSRTRSGLTRKTMVESLAGAAKHRRVVQHRASLCEELSGPERGLAQAKARARFGIGISGD